MQQDFQYILKIYEEGSFSKAAEALYVTQPTLSIAIQKIESSIGMPLFDRSRRPLRLTQAGEIYISMIQEMKQMETDIDHQLQDIRELHTGTLTLGGSHYMNSYILPSVLSQFSHSYPNIQIHLVEESSAVLASMLTDLKLDLTFSCNENFMDKLEKYPAFYDHIMLAVPTNHPINEKYCGAALTTQDILTQKHLAVECPAISLSDFQDLDFILLNEGNNLYDRSIEMFREAGFHPKIRITLAQLVTAYHLAESGYAATLISDRLIRTPTDNLVFYKINSAQTQRLFYILLPNRRYTTHAAKMFIHFFLTNWK